MRQIFRRLFRKALWSILGAFLGSVIALCLLVMVLPCQELTKLNSTHGHFSRSNQDYANVFPEVMYKLRSQLLADLEVHAHDSYSFLLWIAIIVKYSMFMPFLFGKEVIMIICIYYCFPTLRGFISSYTPEWIDDIGSKVAHTFSQDDQEPPPELVIDEMVRISRSRVGYNGSGNRYFETSYITPMKIRYKGSDIDADDWYVFDTTYGVIPITCRDRWNKQAREMEIRRDTSIYESRNRILPPIRFSRKNVEGTKIR